MRTLILVVVLFSACGSERDVPPGEPPPIGYDSGARPDAGDAGLSPCVQACTDAWDECIANLPTDASAIERDEAWWVCMNTDYACVQACCQAC